MRKLINSSVRVFKEHATDEVLRGQGWVNWNGPIVYSGTELVWNNFLWRKKWVY